MLGTGSVGGTYYPLGGAIAQMWSSEIDDLTVSTVATGASVENIQLLQTDEIQLAMAVNGTATSMINQEGEFSDFEGEFQMLGNIYPEVMQIIATEDSGIESVEDLDGARVAIGPDGSGTQILAQEILDAAGVEPAQTFADDFGDAGDSLRDGQIDAAFGILALPDATLTDVAQNTDVTMVSIPDDIRESMEAEDPTLSTLEVEADTYPGIDEAVTLTNWATLYAPSSLSEDQAYELTSLLYEGEIDHAVAESINLDTALEGRVDIELHPGAIRFFEEQGLDVDTEAGEDTGENGPEEDDEDSADEPEADDADTDEGDE